MAIRVGALGLLVGLALLALRPAAPAPRLATYNIRRFGVEATDLDRLVSLLRRVDADVVAVQEIQDRALFERLRDRLSAASGRRYRAVLSRCGGKSEMQVGFLWDARAITLLGTREYPELTGPDEGRCHTGERAALLGEFDAGGRRLSLLVLHLKAGGEAEDARRRRGQWERAFAIADALRADGTRELAILGDTNSTGYLDNRHGERDFIRARAADHALTVITHPLDCSEYFHREGGGLTPSLLDHLVATPGLLQARSVRVHGFCAELACAPQPPGQDPPEFATVSDHCPVSAGLE